jgi:hypothetical protein
VEAGARRGSEVRFAAFDSRAPAAGAASMATVAPLSVPTRIAVPQLGQVRAKSETCDLQVSQRTMILTLYYGWRGAIAVGPVPLKRP